MLPIPIMSTEILVSSAEDGHIEAPQISAADKTGLTINHDRYLANAVCWFNSDIVGAAASASVVGMADRLPMVLSFEPPLRGGAGALPARADVVE
jgi:hypothetical protein